MPSLFSIPTYAPGASLPPRSVQELDRTPAAQSREAASGAAFRDAPQGAGAPAATGATAEPTAAQPQPSAPPVVSTSQAAKLTATVITLQARDEAATQKEEDIEARETQAEAIREAAEPRGTEQQTVEIREKRAEMREEDGPANALAGDPVEADPARQAAEKYRDANETTSAADPGRLLMDA
ncbi:hypothetical protein [Sagittula sp. S175]|uniref:hypothetical protein n=1 Tax=Sagittula sp. S175 TaxID=3415129 RepID=UPI003C7BC885